MIIWEWWNCFVESALIAGLPSIESDERKPKETRITHVMIIYLLELYLLRLIDRALEESAGFISSYPVEIDWLIRWVDEEVIRG